MSSSLRFGFFVAFAILLGAATGVAQSPVSIRVVSSPTDVGAEAFYAQDMGFFKRAGLDVQLTVTNSSAIPPAVASKTFDIGLSNVTTLAAAREHGQPFVIIAPSAIYSYKLRATSGIVVEESSPIRAARDLNGKTVGVNGLRNIGQTTVQAWIDKNGGDSASVKFVEMPASSIAAALARGRIDAGEFSEPELDEALRQGRALRPPLFNAVAKEFVIAAWFCNSDYVVEHRDIAQRYANVMAETARWANTHQAESALILAKWTKLTVAPTMPRVVYGKRLSAAIVQPIIDVSAKYHALAAGMPAEDLIAPGFASK